jgi:hypothetical protein
MLNTLLCLFIGHKVTRQGEFHVVETGRWLERPLRRVNIIRCYRCGCEVERKIKR